MGEEKMKKLFFIAALFFIAVAVQSYEIFFVPGWNTGYDNRIGSVVRLEKAFPNIPIKVKSWNSKVNVISAVKNAETYSKELIEEVLSMPEKRRRELILVGHSLGGKIVINVLNALVDKGLTVHKAVLLGAAIKRDDPAIRRSLFAVSTRILNIYNPDDALLRGFFSVGSSALGSHSCTFTHPRFVERRTTKRNLSPFNHFAYKYIEELQLFVKELPPLYSNIKLPGENSSRIADMKQVNVNDIYWKTTKNHCNWLLQTHYLGRKFRIVDPYFNLRFTADDAAKAETVFADVVSQLDKMGAK